MPSDCISYKKSGYFTTLITDYLDQKSSLQPFYNKFPTIENFEAQIIEKSKNFNCDENYTADAKRKILISVIEQQYKNIEISSESKGNISLLQQATTFTITTGHQLNLFTGPLYFLYKIISTINLTKELKQAYPSYNFVPIYWMATEDHDFEEINYFKYKGSKLKWDKEAAGPVGRLSTTGLELLFETFALKLGMGVNADKLKNLFKKSYLEHTNLADATRFIANELFGEFGLISIDADNQDLKRSFSSFIKEELLRQIAHKKVLESIASLKKYTIQVNPREINLFYIEDNVRERIILENGIYKVNTTQISFSEDEILAAVANNPEKFSPNVIMRPLYQEVILPNLCYIGGGGEIAYWLELKAYFDEMKITFPMLLVRNSAVLLNENQIKKIDKLGLSWADLFSNQKELLTKKTKELSPKKT
jgi:bacillithiol biosynthesis cysteine-adding enzyme BshC